MTTLATTHPTLLDLANITDPEGNIADVVEILNENNDILTDMVWQTGNLDTGYKSTVRTGIPVPTWRKMYGGVQPSKSTTATIADTCGMLEEYSEVDKALADINNRSAAWRLSEDAAKIEGMGQMVSRTLFYGSEVQTPESFTGLTPRFNTATLAPNGENVIKGTGNSTDNGSIWLVVWGPRSIFGITPKGSKAGLQVTDKGQVTVENVDGLGGRMEAYRTHYRWDVGLHVRDWRYIVRICNIKKSTLVKDASSGDDLPDLMFRAMSRVPSLSAGRPAFYMSRDMLMNLRRQATNFTKNSVLTSDNVGGNFTEYFHGVHIGRVDELSADEAQVTT